MKSLINGFVKIDSHERERIEPVQKFFGKNNTSVEMLDYGDYIYIPNDNNDEVAIEVKQVHTDLFSSIESKNLFRQVADMVREFSIHYVLIVGNPEEEIIKNNIIKKKNPNYHWNFKMEQWDGAYTSLCQVTQVAFAYNWNHAIQRMNLLFKKSTDNKNRVYNYMEKFDNPCATFIAGKKRIGQYTAELVTSELGIDTLNDLLSITREDLLSINGIADKKADLILEAIIG